MGKASVSQQPLVANRTKRQQSKSSSFSSALAKLNPSQWFARRKPPSPTRSVYINEPLPADFMDKKGKVLKQHVYSTNQNVTSKYTIITFLPRNLFEQFRRVANVFFLAIAILQFFPKFSTISPGLVILPLLAVLAITAGKDGYEDIKRHQADRKVNHSIVHVLKGPEYKNPNVMAAKDKTFVPGVPMPHFKSKKGRKATGKQVAAGADGVADSEAVEARPGGQDQADLRRMRSQVSTWEEDPEAGDDPKELGWHRTRWEDVAVGDVVKIYDNEQFPADLVICATSEEEDVCYIETKNLDGETNLKSRRAVSGLTDLNNIETIASTRLRIDLEAPEVNMFRLNGAAIKLDAQGHDAEPEIHPITLETTLLRGCVLKNTAWVVGIVIFTGQDSKIVANSGGTPSKRSKVERQMNPQVLINLALLAVIATVCAIIDHFNEISWYRENTYWTLYDDQPGDNPSINGLVTFANAFITFQNIIPISLYISIEFVRTAQAAFIYWDHAMKYVRANGSTTRTIARSWNLSDDLGQINYIFSDKTGTLTQNAMIFRQCSVGGKIYTGDGQVPDGTLAASPVNKKSQSSDSDASSDQKQGSSGDVKVALPKEVLAPFHDPEINRDLADRDGEQSRMLHGFFTVLGLCHTVLAAETEPGVIEYKAQSPDEAALVQSAADVGFVFRGRDKTTLRLSTPYHDEPDEYELLHVLEFNSARKRMSVIIRKLDEDGRLFLLCKGADNVIFERLVKDDSQKELREKTDRDLQQFAGEGLRTLCLAYKVLDPHEYEQWARAYHEATVALVDREDKVEAVSGSIENDLVLLGATAIEDKLQDGVPEAISDLKRAGIKVWVATGDKLETAVAIGYTTNLLTKDTNLIIIREGNYSVQDQLHDALVTFFGDSSDMTRTASRMSRINSRAARPNQRRFNTDVTSLVGQDNGERPGGYSLVIEGHALRHAFEDPETEDLLLDLSTRCNTVVCCRVSPLQKAQIVHLIKDNLGVMCLAIGDGANDVSMIQAADVGVGISGEEGLQAVNSSDYAIAQFRFLTRLLFVHGHWSYFRNSSMILNFFYKNIIGIGVLFWFMIYCGWSTTYVFSYTYLLFWNVFWTIMPVLAIGLFDRNIDADVLMALPELYRYGREGRYFGVKMFLYYIFEGVYQTAVIYFFIQFTYVTTSVRRDGWEPYIYEMSTTMVVGAVMTATLFTALNIFSWNRWTVFALAFGPVLIWVFTAIYSLIPPSSFATGVYGNHVFLFRSYAYWFGVILVTIIALLPRYLNKTFQQNIVPNDIDTMRLVREYQPDVDIRTHPMLGGKLREDMKENQEAMGNGAGSMEARNGEIAMKEMGQARRSEAEGPFADEERDTEGGRPSIAAGRASFSSNRLGRHTSARGSQVDMSTGLARAASRGFDFTMEEDGVAVQRMQSRLSQTSARSRHKNRFLPTLSPIGKSRPGTSGTSPSSPSTPFGLKIRSRAGSILSMSRKRERAGTETTLAAPSTGSAEASPMKSSPLKDRFSTNSGAVDPFHRDSQVSSGGGDGGNGRRGTVGTVGSRYSETGSGQESAGTGRSPPLMPHAHFPAPPQTQASLAQHERMADARDVDRGMILERVVGEEGSASGRGGKGRGRAGVGEMDELGGKFGTGSTLAPPEGPRV